MEVPATVTCPFCGQRFDLIVDTSVDQERFNTDCEVCCRPFDVYVESEPGKIIRIDVFEE